MASTVAGRLLTEQQRRQQLGVRARVLQTVLALWPLFDVTRIDESWAAVGPALVALTERGYGESAAVGSAYYRAFRAAEGVTGALPALAAPAANTAAITTSLLVTGPVEAKRLIALNRPDVAARTLASLSGSIGRHVLDGGRHTVMSAAVAEGRATGRRVGWARVTSAEPCAFCAMLASRGPVYSADTARFQAHDACACTAEPVLRGSQEWPGRAREFRRIYNEATVDAESGDLFNAFRRAYEGRPAR